MSCYPTCNMRRDGWQNKHCPSSAKMRVGMDSASVQVACMGEWEEERDAKILCMGAAVLEV